MKILVMGLPGAGKTFLASRLVSLLLPQAVHLNADEVRDNVHSDLSFSRSDRAEHARRLGWWSETIARSGVHVVADFICPTRETRLAYKPDAIIWLNTVAASSFPDTDAMFVAPSEDEAAVVIRLSSRPQTHEELRDLVTRVIGWDPKGSTALLIGRYQPFHEGHLALIDEALKRTTQVYVAVREVGGINDNNPFEFEVVRTRILSMIGNRRVIVGRVPNLEHVFYGRNVGYAIEYLDLPDAIKKISSTRVRQGLDRPETS